MARNLAADPNGDGVPHSGLANDVLPPTRLGVTASFHTNEYRGRRATSDGGDTLCVTSWSMSTTRPGRGRTMAPTCA